MSRARLGSLLALLWSAVQVWSLFNLRFYPSQHPLGWTLCVVFLAISTGLWLRQPWARTAFLVVGGVLLVSYAVAYYFAQTPCMKDMSGCHPLLILSQPLLTAVGLATLAKPLASNNRSKGRDA
jgi:hypothetical protein